MRIAHFFAVSAVFAVPVFVAPIFMNAQAPAAGETSRAIAGGGISAPGWVGKIDANEEKAGKTINDAKFSKEGGEFHVTTGPAVTYWNPANKASGDYTVKATFDEPKYMNLNSHPHPYGIVMGHGGATLFAKGGDENGLQKREIKITADDVGRCRSGFSNPFVKVAGTRSGESRLRLLPQGGKSARE